MGSRLICSQTVRLELKRFDYCPKMSDLVKSLTCELSYTYNFFHFRNKHLLEFLHEKGRRLIGTHALPDYTE